MSPKDLLLAFVVIAVWGVNFVVIKVGLHGLPPMLLGALRFLLSAFPAVFFVRRPAVPWPLFLAYGATISLGQLGLLFMAMYVGMPAGLASLVLQSQAFFTLVFAALLLGERWQPHNLLALAIATIGLAVIGIQSQHAMPAAGFVLTLLAASMWALGNVVMRRIGNVDLLGLVVWSSLIPPLPFIALSLWFEGPAQIWASVTQISAASVFAVAYLAFGATLLGCSLWGRLLMRYPAAQVAPFSLLVPIVGLSTAALWLGEALTLPQWLGAILVMGGLLVNVLGRWLSDRLAHARRT
ncbi:Cysteine/acetylserine efflux protein [Mycetohabitans rhizoxinica HKI 454]|uniref:Cysteine/acetylserine efflux protein n=2 Tax=Mycetohabitans rhizoxinica TaxID=412963 RepID=E5AP70_MYCRK|nr:MULTISPECIES: O-acetylserine/cysteine exporter [Mycetohabitans]MCG1046615.1 O-acetylserine/cysteine exporter [Mycetohabitans sp. B6]CBW74402.1 Cysteine/acetylserine efflux protein [Mycetohabitans rhizoxinica HKI 454]